ncbi:MAG: 8-oxo-dGTP diphosphatase [Clostridia bacterium]|nr:8-oxo-dGTP diphosphatase [Clostridia bacterium]
MDMTTVCYIERDGKYLMIHRNKRPDDGNAGKWLGVGGHFEPGESPDECVLREVREETGLTLTEYAFRGVVTFVSGDWCEYMFVYTASAFEGELTDACDEGDIRWVDKASLPTLPLWAGDRVFLQLLEEDCPCFSLKLVYEGDALAAAILNGRALDIRGIVS